jgi:hypothetical protein
MAGFRRCGPVTPMLDIYTQPAHAVYPSMNIYMNFREMFDN